MYLKLTSVKIVDHLFEDFKVSSIEYFAKKALLGQVKARVFFLGYIRYG